MVRPVPVLKLFVSGRSASSDAALRHVRRFCDEHLGGRCELTAVDVAERPEFASRYQVVATPTLVREFPPPVRRAVGNLADPALLFRVLELDPPPPAPVSAASPPAAEGASRQVASRRSRSVLVVEDQESSADPLLRLLRYAGHPVAWARTADEALAALDAFRPDLVLLDLVMPQVDGYALAERLRQHPRGRDVPVIVLTAMGPAVDHVRLRRAGVGRVLHKGAVDYHRLLHEIA